MIGVSREKIAIDKTILKRMYVYRRCNQYEIGKRFNCSQWVISNRLKLFGIKSWPKTRNLIKRRYIYNKNFLNELSSDTAWVLGLLVSDGYIRRNDFSGYFGLRMKREDEDAILKMKRIVGYSGPIYKGKRKLEYKGCIKEFHYSLLQINDVKAIDKLERLGIKQNKTLSERFLGCIKETNDEEIISSFIRGIHDGDGSILFDEKRNSSCSQIVGTYHLLQDIQSYLVQYCHVNKTKLTQNILGTNRFALRYRGNSQVIKILDWIYKYSNPYNRMDRKFNKFNEIRRMLSK